MNGLKVSMRLFSRSSFKRCHEGIAGPEFLGCCGLSIGFPFRGSTVSSTGVGLAKGDFKLSRGLRAPHRGTPQVTF